MKQRVLSTGSKLSGSAMVKALTQAWSEAAKKLRKGCRRDPIHFMTPELVKQIGLRDTKRLIAEQSNKPEDWSKWMNLAKETQKMGKKEKRESWAEFSSNLSYREDPRKISKIIKAINRQEPPPTNRALISHTGKVVHSDKEKAKVFRSIFSSISKKPPARKGRLIRPKKGGSR